MAATLNTIPDTWAFTDEPMRILLGTDLIPLDYDYSLVFSRFEVKISGSGPSISETLELGWPGGGITYLVSSTISESGTNWPTKSGGETLEEYADRIAELMHHTEELTRLFHITREAPDAGAEVIRITRKVSEPYALTVTDGLSNVVVTQSSVPVAVVPDNLRALVQVWQDSGNLNTDTMLASLHSPYVFATAQTDIDIAPAFAHLRPHLPVESTINPSPPAASLVAYAATSCVAKYYIRYADKFGTPAVSGALVKNEDALFALLGSRSPSAITQGPQSLCHNYPRRKINSEYQPDWVYYRSVTDIIGAYINLVVYWSDGTSSNYTPWGTTGIDVPGNSIYIFPAGYRQLKLHTLTPSGGTAADAYIVAYDWRLGPVDDSLNWMATVEYRVESEKNAWNMYLLISNGMGGCDSVWIRGKKDTSFEASAEVAQVPKTSSTTISSGQFVKFNAFGRQQWSANTGWYDDPAYTEQLQQLLLGECWLIDVDNRRFLKVIVEPEKFLTAQDDKNLSAIQLTIRAGWIDNNSNK